MNLEVKTDPNCIFCKIVNEEIPCHRIFEDDLSLAFLDLNPVNPGHLLLVPKTHEDHFWDLDGAIYHHLMDVSRKLRGVLKSTYNCPRVGLVIEGFGVAHTHLHLVPIYRGEDLKKSQPPAKPEDLKAEAQKIRKYL